MPARTGTAHVVTTTRTYKDTVYTTTLLRRSYREDGKVKNETLGNLSHLRESLIDIIRRSLQGETFVPVDQAFTVSRSAAHGHVQAVREAMNALDFASLLGTKRCRERDLVEAMVASRILAPHTKLATTRWWHTTTLAEDFGVVDATEDDLYAAMDWLLQRQDRIQKKLATRHLSASGLVLYDLSSSYLEGKTCPLAKLGYSRDRRRNSLQVNYGLLTDPRGCPVAVSVHEGNTSDSTTLLPAVQRLREDYGVQRMVIVGDRGMVSNKAIEELRHTDGVSWICALKSGAIRALVQTGQVQLGLFDERNLFEFESPDFPGERLVACRNGELATSRAHTRASLLAATDAEAALDGIYIIRTCVPAQEMEAADCVRNYKSLASVERAFRSLKTVDLKVRPIHHRTENRVRAHIFLCMLSYYVEWHMREAWRGLMFADTELQAKATRDPVAPAQRSQAALDKVAARSLPDGTPVHSFRTLLESLATIVRNTCVVPNAGSDADAFQVLTSANATQQRALELIRQIHS